MRSLLLVSLMAASTVLADLGCYSSVDTSVYKGSLSFGTQSLCASTCGDDYPYVALKNGGDCYCLSSLPDSSDETNTSQCNVVCKGYGEVMCGGTNAYTVFAGLGTAASSNSAGQSSASKSSSASKAATSTQQSETTEPPASSESPTTTVITASDTTDSNGSVLYRTVTQTSGPSASASAQTSSTPKKQEKSNTGPIVGGVVGGVAALAIIAGAIFFFVRRRYSDDEDDEEEFYKKNGSSAGSVSRSKSKKFNSVFDMPMSNPFVHPSDEFAEKRASAAVPNELTDPRLNPVMMGRRRISEGSLADEADYSRKILGVANP